MPMLKDYTFGMRLKDNFPNPSTPGPLDYSTSCVTRSDELSSPAYSIKCKRYTKESRSSTPSPLDYQSFNLSKLSQPARSYSFGFGNPTTFTIKFVTVTNQHRPQTNTTAVLEIPKFLLLSYFGLLFLLMCLEVTMVVVTFMYRDYFLAGLGGILTDGLIHRYGHKNSNERYLTLSDALDFAQYKFKCCCISSEADYLHSNWKNDSKVDMERRNVPLTCCVMHDPGELSSPAYSIKCKRYTKESRSSTPSPLDYQSFNLSKLSQPARSYSFGFGNRTAFTIKSDTPPPNKYTVPTTIGNNVPDKKKTGRSFSMQGRRKLTVEKSTTPGPGTYETVRVDLYKKKEPAVPFTGHRRSPFLPADPHLPGPSQYNILKCNIDKIKGTCAPRAPFGIRHSPKKFTVFTQADIMY